MAADCFETVKCGVKPSKVDGGVFYMCIPDQPDLLGNKNVMVERTKKDPNGKQPSDDSCARMYKRPADKPNAPLVFVGPCGLDVVPEVGCEKL